MADSKITGLAALTTADPANDMLPIVDVSDNSMAASGTTKRISINNILACSPSATLASATISGDLTVRTNQLIANANGVGVGTAPSAWSGIGPALQVEQASLLSESGNQLYLTANGYFAGGQWNYINNASADQYYQIAGSHVWRSGIGGAGGTAIGWSTLMTLNSTGLGVGRSPISKLTVDKASQTPGGTTPNGALVITDTVGSNLALEFGVNSAALPWIQSRNSTTGTYYDLLLNPNGGNVGIGVTPSGKLEVQESGTGGGIGGIIASTASSGGNAGYVFRTGGTNRWSLSLTGSAGAESIRFYDVNNSATRMTLDASGNLLVASTSTSLTTGTGLKILQNSGVTTVGTVGSSSSDVDTTYRLYSSTASAYRFYVGYGGTVYATNTTISAISDARLKENVQDIDVGLGAILALKPRKFDWKAGKGKDIKGDRGFIAQEFEQVFPQLVDEWADPAPEGEAPYKSVRQDLIPVLVKAIQELTTRVQTLETR